MAKMAIDRTIMAQLERGLKSWHRDEECRVHKNMECCKYDAQGHLVELHLCGLNLAHVPLEAWYCSSLQKLYLKRNRLSEVIAEDGTRLWLCDQHRKEFESRPIVGIY